MPYIIETKPQLPGAPHGDWTEADDAAEERRTRVAVATLEEARNTAHRLTNTNANMSPAMRLDERGGTIGPLLDGTVVEIRAATYDELAGLVFDRDDYAPVFESDIIDAFNAQ